MGLYVQRDALNIAQKSLDIVGNNISNIKTEGYARQRVDVCSVGYAKSTRGYNNTIELSGRGAEAVGVAQIRNRIADRQVRIQSGVLCESGAKIDVLSRIEDIFDSIESDTRDTDGKDLGVSFASILSKLKYALNSYSTDDADRSTMANTTLNAAKGLVECINKCSYEIDKVSAGVIEDTRKTVDRINEIFEELAGLNKSIKDAYVAMGYITTSMNNYKVQSQYGPLELKDKLHLLLDELSQYGNIDYKEEDDGTFTVKFADNIVVKNKYYAQMAMTEYDPRPTELGFVITSNNSHFLPETDAAGNVIDAYGYVNKDIDYRIRGLKDKDEWNLLHKAVGTGGDAQVLLRSDEYKGELLNITGGVDGRPSPQYINSGSLRGLLDIYNGRGDFADDDGKYQNVTRQIEIANQALADLADYNDNPNNYSYGEVEKLKKLIEDSLGVSVSKGDDGKYSVKLNNIELLNADGAKQLEVNAKPGEDYATVTVQGTGELVRQIYTNETAGIEYYRDLLNAFVKTMADTFNGAYSDFDVKVDTAQYVNSYAMQLDEYNKDPQASDLTKQDVQDIIDRLNKVDGVTVSGADGEYKVEYVDANGITYEIVSGGKTDDTLNKLEKDDLPEVNQTSIIKDVDYELFVYDKDFFRNAAEDMRIGDDWLNRPEIIADPTNDNDYEELLNKQINKLLGVFGSQLEVYDEFGHSVPTKHTPEDFVDYICTTIGGQVESENATYEVADIKLEEYEYIRSGDMDVSMEEEGVDMLNFQKWYSAISRMVSTMDELLDKLINNTGIVGLR